MSKILAIAPAYNEEECLRELVAQFEIARETVSNHDLRLLIVENGSEDNSWSLIKTLAETYDWVKGLRLAKNYRMSGALLAGLWAEEADAYVLMAADLQDHPTVIPKLISEWELGFEIVNVRVTERQGTGFVRRLSSQAFYSIADSVSGGAFPKNVSDFRIISRPVRDALNDLPEQKKFLRGTIASLGFETGTIDEIRPPRFKGHSKAGTSAMFALAMRGIIYGNATPLRFASVIGVFASLLSAFGFVFFGFRTLTFGVPFSGFGTLVCLITFGMGIQMLILGIIGEYLLILFDEVRARPNFRVKDSTR